MALASKAPVKKAAPTKAPSAGAAKGAATKSLVSSLKAASFPAGKALLTPKKKDAGSSATGSGSMRMPSSTVGQATHYRFDLSKPDQRDMAEKVISRGVVEGKENVRNEKLDGKAFQMKVTYVLPTKGRLEFDYVVTDAKKAKKPLKRYSLNLAKGADREKARRIYWESVADPGQNLGLVRLDGKSVAMNEGLLRKTKGALSFYYSPPDHALDDLPGIEANDASAAKYQRIEGEAFIKGSGDVSDIDPNDVLQGNVGDCYLLAALAAIAKTDPNRIRKMVTRKDAGIYFVTFYRWDEAKKKATGTITVPVDDRFPAGKTSGKSHYARPGDVDNKGKAELWVLLVEKAWAKVQGSYGQIAGSTRAGRHAVGHGGEMMEALTGKRSTSTNTDDVNSSTALKALSNALSAGHPVTASSRSEDFVASKSATWRKGWDANRMVAGHAYTVVGVSGGKVTLRNPWGHKDPPTMDGATFLTYYRRYDISAA